MTVDRIVHFVAGTMVLLSLVLSSTVDANWMWLAAFEGANLAQSGLTNFCPLAAILKKAGVADSRSCCS